MMMNEGESPYPGAGSPNTHGGRLMSTDGDGRAPTGRGAALTRRD